MMKKLLAVFLALSISSGACAAAGAAAPVPAAPPAPAAQGQLIDQVLAVNGIKRLLERLPVEIAGSLMQAALRRDMGEDAGRELVQSLQQALPRDVFVSHVSAALKKNYDQGRYTHYLQLMSTPLVQRLTELEATDPKPAEVQAFLAQAAKQPLPPARIKLVQRIDDASQASALMARVAMASIEAGALAGGDDCAKAVAQVRSLIAQNRPAIEKQTRASVQVMLAFTYRDVSDANLDAYATAYEDRDSRWIMDLVQAALVEQFAVSMQSAMQGVKKIVLAHTPKKTMFAPKCGEAASPAEEERMKALQATGDKAAQAPRKAAEPKVTEPKVAEPKAEPKVVAAPKVAAAAPAAAASEAAPAQPAAQRGKEPAARVAALDSTAAKVRRYARPERDLRDCLSLPSSAAIIACVEK